MLDTIGDLLAAAQSRLGKADDDKVSVFLAAAMALLRIEQDARKAEAAR